MDPFSTGPDEAPDSEAQQRAAVRARYQIPDIPAEVIGAINQTFNTAAMSFPANFPAAYQQAYEYFDQGFRRGSEIWARLSEGGTVAVPEDAAAELKLQADALTEMRDGQAKQQDEFNEEMARVAPQMQADNQRAFEERMRIQRQTNEEVGRIHAETNRRMREAADRAHEQWMRNNT